uniref:SEC10/PgrA surface exclusion domain-containing protein n=1 Tax=Streptococcus pluranimalium TaxID=82348 RepID=UPI003F69004B
MPGAETVVIEAQAHVDNAQSLADTPVTHVVDQEAVKSAQAEVDEQSKNVSVAQSEITKANADLSSAKAQAAEAETLLSRIGSDTRAMLQTDFDFEDEYGITAMDYWNSVGGDTNVNSLDGKHTSLSEDLMLIDTTFDLADEVFFDNPNSVDSAWELDLNDLSGFELRTLSNYAANTINGLRESMQKQLKAAGSNLVLPKVQVTEESIVTARKYFDWLRANYPGGYENHVVDHARASDDLKNSTLTWEEVIGNAFSQSASKNMLGAKRAIFDQLSKMLFKDAIVQHGHTSVVLGMEYASMGVTGTQTLTFTPINFDNGTTKFSFVFTRPDENVIIPNTLPALSEEELSALKSAKASVTKAANAVQEATTKYANAKAALTAAEEKLAAVKKGDVAAAQKEAIRRLNALEDAKNDLVAAKNKVAELKSTISAGQAKLDAHKNSSKAVAEAKAKLEKAEKALSASKVKTAEAKTEYEKALADFKAAKAEYSRLLAIRVAEDATQPADEAAKPADNVNKPADNSSVHVENTTKPEEDTTQPADEAVKPAENVNKPVENATAHAEDVTKPADDSTVHVDSISTPAEDVTKPVDEVATQHADNTSAPAEDAIKHAEDATQPVDNTTKPVDNGQKATKPNEAGKLALNTTKKENHNQVKTLGAGITQKADGTISYSRVSANNTLPKTGEENNTSSFLAGLALLLSGSLFLGKRKED